MMNGWTGRLGFQLGLKATDLFATTSFPCYSVGKITIMSPPSSVIIFYVLSSMLTSRQRPQLDSQVALCFHYNLV
jgi:hypothetical protein